MARVFANEAFKACQEQDIDSRYEMILLAAYRAKKLRSLPNDKKVLPAEEYITRGTSPAVTVLREIESGNLDVQELKDEYIKSFTSLNENTDLVEEEETENN
jgi:DNA-directed RNA polymerase subunit K/omega